MVAEGNCVNRSVKVTELTFLTTPMIDLIWRGQRDRCLLEVAWRMIFTLYETVSFPLELPL